MAKQVNVNEYKKTDSGRFGKAFERTLTEKDRCKDPSRVDWYHLGIKYELKTSSGTIDKLMNKNSKRKIIYVPVPVENNGYIDPYAQEGFILDRATFIDVLEQCGLIRYEKVSTQGTVHTAIQTFWNRSKNAPHGSKYYKLINALYENCIETLEEMLERDYPEQG